MTCRSAGCSVTSHCPSTSEGVQTVAVAGGHRVGDRLRHVCYSLHVVLLFVEPLDIAKGHEASEYVDGVVHLNGRVARARYF